MEKNKTDKFIWLGLLGIVITGLFVWFRNNTKKLTNLTEYSISSIKVHKVGILDTEIKVSVLIKNPSDLAIKLDNYKVEIKQTADITKTLATSVVTSLIIPAKSSIVNDIVFKLSNLKIGTLLLSAIQTGLETQLKGKFSFTIKGETLGQYFEKEIKF